MSDQPKKATIEDIVAELKSLNETARDQRHSLEMLHYAQYKGALAVTTAAALTLIVGLIVIFTNPEGYGFRIVGVAIALFLYAASKGSAFYATLKAPKK